MQNSRFKIENKSSNLAKRRNSSDTDAFARIFLYLLTIATPFLLVFTLRPRTDHNVIYEVGKSFALLGLTIIAMQFVLAARLRWIEKPFGLDFVIKFHQRMGMFAAVLLLVHPLLLAFGEKGFAIIFSPDVRWYIWVARIALLMLMIHTLISGFRGQLRLEFQKWFRFHNVLAISILFFGFLHSSYAGGDLSIIQVQVFWVCLIAMALITYIYHHSLRPKQLYRQPYKVIKVLKECHNVWTIRLVPPDEMHRFLYLPGQFHFITLYRGKDLPVEEHPFTISSSPTQPDFISSTIKQSGDFTATIGSTKPGDIAVVHGPFGRFSYLLHQGKDLIFVAGGVGITPLMSMLRHMRDTRSDIHVLLLCANRTQKDIIFGDELVEIEKCEYPRLQTIHILSRPDENWTGEVGRLNGNKIRQLCGGSLQNKTFYLCGPPVMTRKLISDLMELGVPDTRLHFEEFSF
jgi:predicted ferric reductase